jgi:hypothetical protein
MSLRNTCTRVAVDPEGALPIASPSPRTIFCPRNNLRGGVLNLNFVERRHSYPRQTFVCLQALYQS